MSNYFSQTSGDIIGDEQPNFHINRFLVSLKLDLDLRAQDDMINKPDTQDLELKLRKLENDAFQFRNHKPRLNYCPLKPKQISSNSLDLSLSPQHQSQGNIPSNTKIIFEQRKQGKTSTLGSPRCQKMIDNIAINENRFQSRKKSQFSYQGNSNIDVPIESNYYPGQRRERSINVITPLQQQQQEQSQRAKRFRNVGSKKSQPQLGKELEIRIPKRNSNSSSHVSTPNSILKTPSHGGGSLMELRINSRQSNSSVNVSHSPSRGSNKKVRFCLTRTQARRENIIC